MKIEELTFPLTVEAFAAYQESLINRKFGVRERDALKEWMPVLNASYEDGCRQNSEALLSRLAKIDALKAKHGANTVIYGFLQFMRRWVSYAWEQGQEAQV